MNNFWCTYKTTHPSGFYYQGKGISARVESGAYTGSGVRFKLAQQVAGYEPHTWTTTIIDTFQSEDEAFTAEETLVPLELLADPYCLNMMKGGCRSRGQDVGLLYRRIKSQEKKERKAIKDAKLKAKMAQDKLTIQRLKDENARLK